MPIIMSHLLCGQRCFYDQPLSQIFAPHKKSFAHASRTSGSYTSSSVRRRRTGTIPAVKSRLWMSSCHKRRGYQSLWVWPCKLFCQPANRSSGNFSSTSTLVKTSTHKCSSMSKSNSTACQKGLSSCWPLACT